MWITGILWLQAGGAPAKAANQTEEAGKEEGQKEYMNGGLLGLPRPQEGVWDAYKDDIGAEEEMMRMASGMHTPRQGMVHGKWHAHT